MRPNVRLLECFAPLLEYPVDGYRRLVETSCQQIMTGLDAMGVVGKHLVNEFQTEIMKCDTNDLEELYTRTFDLNPVCTLDLGWHLYEENYDRGAFLVQLREALRRNGIPETTELPDHLPSVLKLLSRVTMEEGAALVQESVLPALKKMLKAFPEPTNPYGSLLKALEITLQQTFACESGVPNHG